MGMAPSRGWTGDRRFVRHRYDGLPVWEARRCTVLECLDSRPASLAGDSSSYRSVPRHQFSDSRKRSASRLGYSDFRFDQVVRSFVTQGGDLVQLIQDAFSGTTGLGGEFLQFSESGHFLVSASAEYRRRRTVWKQQRLYGEVRS